MTDFVVVSHDTRRIREKMLAIGAIRVEKLAYTAYLWSERLTPCFFSGLGVLDGALVVGPRRLQVAPSMLGAGNYVVVTLGSVRASIHPDPFGMAPVYASAGIVTNRLHLAAIVVEETNVSSALTATYNEGGFSFSQNTFNTAVAGVRLIPAGASVEVDDKGVHVSELDEAVDFQEADVSQYWSLIEEGAEEIVANVKAITSSGLPVFSDITGGKDSRLVLGALIAGGGVGDVIFNTITNNPTLQRDLEIGTGLVKLYGGSYQDRPRASGYSKVPVHANVERRRSQIFGTYHWFVDSDIRPVRTLFHNRSIRMLGGGGELYRSYWQPMLFTSAAPNVTFSREDIANLLGRHRGNGFGKTPYRAISDELVDTFDHLPGKTQGDRLDAHYLHFRNRFHFGLRMSLPESMSTINVAMSRRLLAAYRCLPPAERASGRVLFDVTRTLDEKLAYLPYDQPLDRHVFDSRFHRVSKFDGMKLPLQPAPEIALASGDARRFCRVVRPSEEDWSMDAVLDEEIRDSLAALGQDGEFASVLDLPAIRRLVDWAAEHSPRTRSALASKLRWFSDLSTV